MTVYRPVTLVHIASSPAVRLCTGGADLVYSANTYLARHSDIGEIVAIAPIQRGLVGEVPRTQLQIAGANATGLAWLADEARLTQAVTIYKGTYDPTDASVDGVSVEFVGELGQIEVLVGNPITATVPVFHFINKGFDAREGSNYNDAVQQRLYAGDLGLGFVAIGGERAYPAAQDVTGAHGGGVGGTGDYRNVEIA